MDWDKILDNLDEETSRLLCAICDSEGITEPDARRQRIVELLAGSDDASLGL